MRPLFFFLVGASYMKYSKLTNFPPPPPLDLSSITVG